MEEYVIRKVLESNLSEKEIEFVKNNKETSSLLYLVGVIDTIRLIDKLN